MRTPRTRLVLLATTLLLAAGCADHAGPPALEARQAEFLDAIAARDADRLARLFAADAVLHVAGMPPVEGRDAIHQLYANMFRFMAGSHVTPGALEIARGGDMAWAAGAVTNRFQRPDGEVEYPGKYAIVWRRADGEWLVALYAVSSDR